MRPRKSPTEVPGFKAYLMQSLYSPFVLNLEDSTLMEVINSCISAKSKLHRNYRESLGCLIHNLNNLELEYGVTLLPVQITDIFWEYFISFCQDRGLKASSIETMCNQLRSILNWAVKYNAKVSPTYGDFKVPKVRNNEIALTADEISRIAYFDIDRFYAKRRADFRKTMHKVRDHFVLSANLFQRYSDMVRIEPSCFERNIFRITQQKTGALAVVNIDRYAIDAKTTYRILEKYGYEKAESILNEWNYIKGWKEEYHHSIMTLASQKGAAFAAASMIACQHAPVDMLMYYDAKPDAHFNGMFDKVSLMPLKPYYAIYAWGSFAAMCDRSVKVSSDVPDIYAVAGRGADRRRAIFLARYSDDDNFASKRLVTVRLSKGTFPREVTSHITDDVRTYTEMKMWPAGPTELSFRMAPHSFTMLEYIEPPARDGN